MQTTKPQITHSKTPLSKAIMAILAGLVLSQSALADQYHYKDQLIGDRAAGLGGAYTAIADDASGLYYNPAGVVYTSKPKVSGSVNAYNLKTTTYTGISTSNPDQEWTRSSSGMVANFFGMVQPLGDSTVGFSIAIPNADLEDQSDSFTNLEASKRLKDNGAIASDSDNAVIRAEANNAVKKQEIDYNNSDNTTLIGVSYATPITKDLSFGITLYGYMRKKELTLEMISIIKGYTGTGTSNLKSTYYQKIQTDEVGIQPRIGFMWAPAEKLSIGLMFNTTFILSQTPKSRVNEELCSTQGCYSYDKDSNSYKEIASADYLTQAIELQDTAENDLPLETHLGVAYFATDALLYTADFDFYSQTDRYASTYNVSAGAEYFVSPTWAIRGGLFTNNANTSTDVATYVDDHVDLYGGSFSFTRYTKTSNITAGMSYSAGSGKANLFGSSSNTQDISVSATSLFVSTSASF